MWYKSKHNEIAVLKITMVGDTGFEPVILLLVAVDQLYAFVLGDFLLVWDCFALVIFLKNGQSIENTQSHLIGQHALPQPMADSLKEARS